MMQLYYTALEAGICSFILIPIFMILHKIRFHSTKSTLLYVLFAIYLTGVYAVVGLPNINYVRFEPDINFLPFRNMLSDLSGSLLNVILFIPLGLFSFLLWKPFRTMKYTALFGFSISLFIELLQLFTYRATDINDLITNTVGSLLGYFCGMLLTKNNPSLICRNSVSDLPFVLIIPLGIMFFLQPIIWNIIY